MAAGIRLTGGWVVLAAIVAACGGGGAASPAEPETPPGGAPVVVPPNDTSAPRPAVPTSAVFDTPDKYFVPTEVTIAVGGTVTWKASDNSHEIFFDGNAPPGGDIAFLKEGNTATRTFPTAGTYRFHCDRHDDVGVIHVVASTAAGDTTRAPTGGSGGAIVTTPGVTFSPATVTIAAGRSVTWQFTGIRHNVTFRGAAPQGGSIPDTDPGRSVSRTFIAAGTYDYDCTRHSGMSGRVVVQ